MYKTTSKTSLFLASCMLGIILLSLVSSGILYRQIMGLQSGSVNTEVVDFINEFEYELMDSAVALSEAYKLQSIIANNEKFDRAFKQVLGRTASLSLLEKQYPDLKNSLNVSLVVSSTARINNLIYNSAQIQRKTEGEVQRLFADLTFELHRFQLNWGHHNNDMMSTKHFNTLVSYQNSLLLIFVTLFIGIVMVIYLFKNNRTLLELQRTLEKRVYKRTKELSNSNENLHLEINERKKIEEALTESQQAAEIAHQRLQHQANFDPLTKLANRHLFIERFNEASNRTDRNSTLVALLFIDLDRFKHVNDTLGHTIGDELLIEAAVRIEEVLRSSDTAARFGGDEFAIVLSDIVEIRTVELIVSRIIKTLGSPFHLSGNEAFVSASIGITMYPRDGDNIETLLRKADSAMYKAKDAGKNNFKFFTQKMNIEATERRSLETALYKAVEEQQFHIEYQPIYDVQHNKIAVFEALIGWNLDSQGKIPAEKFIPLAEEIGLILPIGKWLLDEVCKTAVTWIDDGASDFLMSVNISSRQFQKCNMADDLEKTLRETGLDARYLMIEITENLLISNHLQTLEQLNKIRKMGVHIAFDGFGTGYSSLSFLRKYPITTLKIDQSFIKNISGDCADIELIKSILSIAENLNLKVIAEGVENKTQVDFLVKNNCGFLQGDYYSPPLPAINILELLEREKTQAPDVVTNKVVLHLASTD